MANKYKMRGKLVTPVAEVIYLPHLREKRKFNRKENRMVPSDDGSYGMDIALNTANKAHKDFMDKLNKLNDEAHELCKGAAGKKELFKPVKDQEGMFKFSLTQPGGNAPAVIDANKAPVPDSVINQVASGTVVQAVFTYNENDYEDAAGIKIYLDTVQIRELSTSADANLFDEVDGEGFVVDGDDTDFDESGEDLDLA